MRSDDISKIINAYKNRKAENKYSYIALLSEVQINDYNLNIPRYVDTCEEEDTIDLKTITNELRELALLGKTTDRTIADFCDELGIETPF